MTAPKKAPKGSSYAPFGSDKPRDRTYYGDTGPDKHAERREEDPPNYGSEYSPTDADDYGVRRGASEAVDSPKRVP